MRVKNNFNKFFNAVASGLKKEYGMDDTQIQEIRKSIEAEMENVEPPKIAIIGFTGVGKSSTINALFNAGREISDVRACTKEVGEVWGDILPYLNPEKAGIRDYKGSKGNVILYDMPGLGEDINSDPIYYEMYKRVLPGVDVAIWTFHANDRTMAPMQGAIRDLKNDLGPSFVDKLMFSINKVDAIAPGELDWNIEYNIPSKKQTENITETECYVREKVQQMLPGWDGQIVSYSAKRRYRLDILMTAMMDLVPENRKWVFDSCADVADYQELIKPEILAYLNSIVEKQKRG